MGLLDAPAPVVTSGQFAVLTSRLVTETEDAVLAVLGDSTGNETTEWVYLTAQWLAARFPRWTVLYRLWNDTSQGYDTAVTVQTGTGLRTLTIYNASTSGMATTYSLTRIAAQIPVTPHVIVVNYGHNDGGATPAAARRPFYALTRLLEDWWPGAGLVLTAQNPRAPDDAAYSDGLARNQAIIDLAATEGYGLINVTESFLAVPSYDTTLLAVDGLHPNSSGSQRWAGLVQTQLRSSLLTPPRATPRRAHRIYIPATAFTASEGSPTFATVGTTGAPFPTWALDASAQEAVVAGGIDFPDWWQSINIYVVWAVATGSGYNAGNNGVRWAVGRSRYPITTGIPFDSPTGTKSLGAPNNLSDATALATAQNSGAWAAFITRVLSDDPLTYRPINLRVKRNATDGADTLAEDAHVRGVFIERAA